MPVQLSNGSFLEMLLGASNIMTCRQVRYDLLSCPPAIEDSGFGITEAPLEVHDGAAVCALTSKVVRVL